MIRSRPAEPGVRRKTLVDGRNGRCGDDKVH